MDQRLFPPGDGVPNCMNELAFAAFGSAGIRSLGSGTYRLLEQDPL